ncbi:MAG: transposase [Patescibacteria group bacterium]
MRRAQFENGEYYHIFNRGTDKRKIFLDRSDYFRFLKSLKEFNQEEPVISLYIKDQLKSKLVGVRPLQEDGLVEIVALCLLPNHFHLILKQIKSGGISEFMKRLGCGFTGFFNHKHKRSGVLFQGKFKSIHIDSNEYLLYLSAYVNGNHKVHNVKKSKVINSFDLMNSGLIDMGIILNDFEDVKSYKDYVITTSSEVGKIREELKEYSIE